MTILTIILQIALGVFARNPELSAGNLCGYFPQDTAVSAAPKGYKPFYISHIARHGSRFLSNGEPFQVVDTLTRMAAEGMLTGEGLELLEDLKMLHGMSEGHYGALTLLGAQEHRDICSRMFRHYPEVFSDKSRRKVQAYSTESERVKESMAAFTGELSARAPGLEIGTKVVKWSGDDDNQEVTGFHLSGSKKDEAKAAEKDFSKVTGELRRGYDYKVFASRIFRNPSLVPSRTVKYVAKSAFKSLRTGRVTYPETMPGMGKYFTPEELYSLWLSGSLSWAKYLTLPGYSSAISKARGMGIFQRMIEDADRAMASGSPVAATFRFSHDTYMLPLMAAIPLEGTVLDCSDREIPEHFQDYNFVCPACNVQLVFYRSRRGPVLVKFLLNEKETLVHGLEPLSGCFYEWEKVKQYK